MEGNALRGPGTENELQDCRRAGAVCSKHTNMKCTVELQICLVDFQDSRQ